MLQRPKNTLPYRVSDRASRLQGNRLGTWNGSGKRLPLTYGQWQGVENQGVGGAVSLLLSHQKDPSSDPAVVLFFVPLDGFFHTYYMEPPNLVYNPNLSTPYSHWNCNGYSRRLADWVYTVLGSRVTESYRRSPFDSRQSKQLKQP